MQGLGVTSIKKEPMHAAVVASLLQSPFLSVFTLFIYLGVRFLCEVHFAVKRLVALTFRFFNSLSKIIPEELLEWWIRLYVNCIYMSYSFAILKKENTKNICKLCNIEKRKYKKHLHYHFLYGIRAPVLRS